MSTELFEEIKLAFKAQANDLRAEKMAAYMRHQFVYYGISSPVRKTIQSDIFTKWKSTTDLEDFVRLCWEQDQREWKYVALDYSRKVLKKGDLSKLVLFESLITDQSWWDTVDSLSPNLLAKILMPHHDLRKKKMYEWIESDSFWLRRAAIILQLTYGINTDFELMKELILKCSSSKEFFIQKASGWALRQYSKFNPEGVKNFIQSNTLAPLTRREGLRLINPA